MEQDVEAQLVERHAQGVRLSPLGQRLAEQAEACWLLSASGFEFESYAVAEAVVSVGVAVSFIPHLALGDRPGTMHRPLESTLHRKIQAAVPSDTRHSPLTSVFLDLLRSLRTELGE